MLSVTDRKTMQSLLHEQPIVLDVKAKYYADDLLHICHMLF